jgi:hypothetical protein
MSNVIADDFSVNDAVAPVTAVPIELTYIINPYVPVTAFTITDGNNVTDDEPGKWMSSSYDQLNKMIEDLAAIRRSFSE